jgi:hypothetical protein
VRVSEESNKPPRKKNGPTVATVTTMRCLAGRARNACRAPAAKSPSRSFDWGSTDLGPVSKWSQPVRRAVAICASIASAQHEALISVGRAQHRRIAELGRQNNALHRQIARRNATLDTVQPQFEVLDNVPWMIWTVAPDGGCDLSITFTSRRQACPRIIARRLPRRRRSHRVSRRHLRGDRRQRTGLPALLTPRIAEPRRSARVRRMDRQGQ